MERKRNELPKVSVVIPMRNEEKFIKKCLESILQNDYPKDKLEIIIVDGMSSDRSKELAMEYESKYGFIKVLDNPKRIQASALNIGIKESKGEIIIRMDAHTIYDKDYIKNCVDLLMKTDAKNVGGVQYAVGTNYITKAIALAMNSPFGAGDAKFRYAQSEMLVDTVYLGAWWKKTLVELGGFSEWAVKNQDYELNYRIRKAGGKILLSPKIKCKYYVRSSLWKFIKQYFTYGIWKVRVLKEHPGSLRYRQLVPPLFVLALLMSIAILPLSVKAGMVVPVIYTAVNILVSLKIALKNGIKYLPVLPIVFATMHISWGLGFLYGLVKFGLPKFKPEHIINSFKKIEQEA